MAPQPRSKTGRTTRSSVRAKAPPAAVATINPTSSNMSKVDHNQRTSKSKHVSESKRPAKRAKYETTDSETAPAVKTRKRAKTSARLEVFKDMPVEVFIEIAKHLHPFDLVLFSRVNKFFRDMFMSRHATPIWRSALQNVPKLPPCPRSVCEPQYAALLFTKMCSTCGKWAPRNMDPVLLVRLCTKCRDKQAIDTSIVTDRTLVFSSHELVPGQHRGTSWCLYGDARAIKSKLNQFVATGDMRAKARWEKKRRAEVNQRRQDAQQLKLWLKDRDREREAELDQIKRTRKLEIESRLAKLGWEKDIATNDYQRNKEWNLMVYNTKPLTDRAWEKLLPDLLAHLEVNREQRLQREMSERRYERQPILQDYMYGIMDRLGPFARAVPENGSSIVTSVDAKQSVKHKDRLLLARPFPSPALFLDWPELKDLVEDDMPMQRFKERLDEKQDVMKALITSWTNTIEACLVNLLPKHTPIPKLDHVPGFTLMLGTGDDSKSISIFPKNLQKLLRADAIFIRNHHLVYYPDDFELSHSETSDLAYHMDASKVAKALLSVLSRPNASYLELKALGRVFACGRCNSPPEYMSWKEMIKHYLTEADQWSRDSRRQQVHEAKDLTLVFTHDTDLVKPEKPLVRIVDYNNQVPEKYGAWKLCKLCQGVKISKYCHTEYIVDHLRDVHLIEEPELGKHYD